MYENSKKYQKVNDIRITLLDEINLEYISLQKKDSTKINSKGLEQIEKNFRNTVYYKMPEKKLFQDSKDNNFICDMTSPDSNKESSNFFINRHFMRHINKKNSVSSRKLAYFRTKTLKQDLKQDKIDDMIEYININNGILHNKKTLERSEKGFTFLHKLSHDIKVLKGEEVEYNFDEMKKILCLKENIDDNSFDSLNHKSRSNSKKKQNNLLDYDNDSFSCIYSNSISKPYSNITIDDMDEKNYSFNSDFQIKLYRCKNENMSNTKLIKLIRADSFSSKE